MQHSSGKAECFAWNQASRQADLCKSAGLSRKDRHCSMRSRLTASGEASFWLIGAFPA